MIGSCSSGSATAVDSRTRDVARPVFLTFDGEVAPGEPFAYMAPNAVVVEAISNKGGGNFVVMQSDGTWPDLLINEIGTYNGTVPLSSGPSLLLITADGKWTMTEE